MKSVASLVSRFRENLKSIPEDIRRTVNRPGGLGEEKLLDLIINPQDYGVLNPEHPEENDVCAGFDEAECCQIGENAIKSGQVAYCVMAGGAGTRIGEPKALLRIPGLDMSLLSLKLMQAVGSGPIWIVVSPALRSRIEDHLSSQSGPHNGRIRIIEQYESYRLLPDNSVSMKCGVPDLYPCGHGDLFPALHSSRLLEEFSHSGGKYVSIVNVDNVMASLDPIILGRHIVAGKKVSCEVVKRSEKDSGGALCNVQGSLQIVESFRISGVDPKSFQWLNTNSFVMDADVDVKSLGNSWNRVQKNTGNSLVVQHERLLQEITEAYDTSYLAVKRSERFLPIKNAEDLVVAATVLDAEQRKQKQ